MYSKESAFVTQQHWLRRCSGARGDVGVSRGALAQAEPQQQMLTWLFWPGGPLSFSVSNKFLSQNARPKAQGMGGRECCSRGVPQRRCHTTGLATGAAPSLSSGRGLFPATLPADEGPVSPGASRDAGDPLMPASLPHTGNAIHRECHTPRMPTEAPQPPGAHRHSSPGAPAPPPSP